MEMQQSERKIPREGGKGHVSQGVGGGGGEAEEGRGGGGKRM